jgi:uncharacterized membrane protein
MSPRTLKILCAVSILLNLFLIGGGIGGLAWLHARPALAGLRAAGGDLPRDQRKVFRSAARDARLEMRPTALEGRRARADAAALLRAPTLDQPALNAALARLRAADIAIRTHVEERIVTVAGTFSPADRAILADGMQKKAGRPRR